MNGVSDKEVSTIKKKHLVKIAGVSTILFVGLLAATGMMGNVSAHMGIGEKFSPDVVNIATQLNMEESEVQAVLDAVQDERHDHMQEMLGAHLDSAVEDGTITEEDKAAILAKHEELHQQMESLMESDLTQDEIRDAHRGLMDELRSWMQANGYDVLGPQGPHHGPMGLTH